MLRNIKIINRYEVLENKSENVMCNTSYIYIFSVSCILVMFTKMFQGFPGCASHKEFICQ